MLKLQKLVNTYILKDSLACTDPYDIWATSLGIFIKKLFYKNKLLGYPLAAIWSILDLFGMFKEYNEYPIVRALDSQACLNMFELTKKEKYLQYAYKHLIYLKENFSKGYSGYCWGLNQPWMSKNTFYPEETPHVTHTPYPLEAFVKFRIVTGSKEFDDVIKSVLYFLEKDISVIYETEDELAMGYSPLPEKYIVINANSYVMYMYAILLDFYPEKKSYIVEKINKIYNFICNNQEPDGSWWYYVKGAKGNFIDCFHSCFIMKNIIKTTQIIHLSNWKGIVEKGYNYLLDNFFDKKNFLVKRFSKSDKFNLVKWDLYDNAEFLNLSILLGKMKIAEKILNAILKTFVKNEKEIYSQIWIGGIKRYKNTLRWAVMPFIYTLSEYLLMSRIRNK